MGSQDDDEVLDQGHDHSDDDDEMDDEEEDDIVVLSDAEGNETEFQFLAIVEVEGGQYALLTPNVGEDEDESTEIFIFKYEQDEDGGETFSDVDDEATFAKVRAEAENLFSSLDDEEAD